MTYKLYFKFPELSVASEFSSKPIAAAKLLGDKVGGWIAVDEITSNKLFVDLRLLGQTLLRVDITRREFPAPALTFEFTPASDKHFYFFPPGKTSGALNEEDKRIAVSKNPWYTLRSDFGEAVVLFVHDTMLDQNLALATFMIATALGVNVANLGKIFYGFHDSRIVDQATKNLQALHDKLRGK